MAKKVYLQGEEFIFSRVKGNKESDYREGDVNITPANIGASAEGHTHDDRYYTESEINTKLNSKANNSHTHGNGDITSLDAGKITSGIISIDRLPQGALDRLIRVTDDTARFKLTTADVQLGDTVQTTNNGKMYYVVDESKLSSANGYAPYTADTATSVPWSGVTGKPSSYTPSAHNHDDRYYTETEMNTKLGTKVDLSADGVSKAINKLSTGTDIPSDADYYISQYASGGTTTTSYHRKPVSALWSYIKSKADKVYSALGHKHTKSEITDFPSSMPASDVPAWAKESTKPSYTKAEVGLGNVNNTADSAKNVKYAASAGSAGTAAKVPWSGVTDKPTTYTPSSHTHDDRYYTETEIDTKLKTKSNTNTYIRNNGEGISIAPTSLITPDGLQHINYTLDILPATSETIGGVKVGNTLTIDNGILNAKQIGIEGADTESCTTTFTSGDSSTGDSTAPAVITSGETHKSLFNKISTAVKNVRWLLNKMGTTDISAIGNGTVTGALSTLNSNIRNIHPSKTYGSSIEIPELGITTSTSINQLIEGGVLPNGYTIELWCNTETYWGNEIRDKLKSRYSVDFFGYVTMHRSFDGNFVTIECRPFNTNDIYLNGWTNVNNIGWHAHWDKVSLV